jgi:hypothetical protein
MTVRNCCTEGIFSARGISGHYAMAVATENAAVTTLDSACSA